MSFNHINTTNKKEKTDIYRSEKSYSAYGHKAGDFSEILKEARRATNDPNQEREFVKKTESDSEQESEWEQKQLKISGPGGKAQASGKIYDVLRGNLHQTCRGGNGDDCQTQQKGLKEYPLQSQVGVFPCFLCGLRCGYRRRLVTI